MPRPSQLLHPQRDPAPLRPAATVLLLRDSPQGIEVLMTRRSMTASFAPGAYVFPGGGIDAADGEAHAHATRRPTQSDTHVTQAIAAIPNVSQNPAPEINILEFTPEGPKLAVRPYTHTDHYWQVYFDTNKAIVETLGAAGYRAPETPVVHRNV